MAVMIDSVYASILRSHLQLFTMRHGNCPRSKPINVPESNPLKSNMRSRTMNRTILEDGTRKENERVSSGVLLD